MRLPRARVGTVAACKRDTDRMSGNLKLDLRMAAHSYNWPKNHRRAGFMCIDFMACKLCLNKAFFFKDRNVLPHWLPFLVGLRHVGLSGMTVPIAAGG